MTPTGFDLHDTVNADVFSESSRSRPLSHLGLVEGDVVTFSTPAVNAHFELRSAA